jgi:hypothetical protein
MRERVPPEQISILIDHVISPEKFNVLSRARAMKTQSGS